MPDYRRIGMTIAQKHGIPWNIFNATINAESSWRPDAKSPSGAKGFSQLMPGTAMGLGVNPDDPIQNLEGGARYLAQQYKRFKNWRLALAAYNAGPGAVERYGGIPPYADTQRYVEKIMGAAHGSVDMPAPSTAAAAAQLPGFDITAVAGGPSRDLAQLLQYAAPSARSVGILQDLGGIAARVAQNAQTPIPLPGGTSSMTTPGEQASNVPGLIMPPPHVPEADHEFMTQKTQKAIDVGGFIPRFKTSLDALIEASGGRVTIGSGYRSVKEQQVLWTAALKKYGSVSEARKWVAPPGRSNHNKGIAADLHGNLEWAHANAARFGLYFPMGWEPWHIEIQGSRG